MNSIFPPSRDPWIEKAATDPEATVNALLDIIDEDRTKICRAIDATTALHASKYEMSKAVTDELFGRGR